MFMRIPLDAARLAPVPAAVYVNESGPLTVPFHCAVSPAEPLGTASPLPLTAGSILVPAVPPPSQVRTVAARALGIPPTVAAIAPATRAAAPRRCHFVFFISPLHQF